MGEEQKWIRDIQRRGSRQAADKLVRAYDDEIYRFAHRQLGHKEDALDLTQNVFLAVLRALPTFDGRKASFRTWLYRIAAHMLSVEHVTKRYGKFTALEDVNLAFQPGVTGLSAPGLWILSLLHRPAVPPLRRCPPVPAQTGGRTAHLRAAGPGGSGRCGGQEAENLLRRHAPAGGHCRCHAHRP